MLLSIERISDDQGHSLLICELSFYLQSFLSRLQDIVERKLVKGLGAGDVSKTTNEIFRGDMSRKSMMVDGAGSSYLDPINHLIESIDNMPQMLYCLNQIQFQVQLMRLMSVAQTLLQGYKVKSDFLLSKYLVSCIDACSNLCRDHPKLVFTHDERLPNVIKCD